MTVHEITLHDTTLFILHIKDTILHAISSKTDLIKSSMLFLCLLFFTVLSPKDPMAIERSNLLSMMKLSIKVLIQSSLSLGRTLDSDYPPLQQFFVVLEHCLKHGLKGETVHEADLLNRISFI